MKANRFELAKKFEMLLPAVGFNAMLPEYQRFRISNSTISATDGSMQIVTFLPVDLGFSCSIPARDFYGVLSSLQDEEVDITLDRATSKLLIKTKKVVAEFASYPYKPLPEIEPVGTPWSIEKIGGIKSLVEKLTFCQSVVSKDDTAGVFCGVLIDKEYIVASDQYRVCRSKYLVNGEPLIDHVISIPSAFVDLIKKYADNLEFLGLCDANRGQSHVQEKLYLICKDGTLLVTTLYSENYHDTRKFFSAGEFRTIVITPEIFSTIEHHALFLKHMPVIDQDITVQFKNKTCTVSSEIKQTATLKETFDTEEDWDLTLFVNPAFFYDANQKMTTQTTQPDCAPAVHYFTENGNIISVRGDDEYLITARG